MLLIDLVPTALWSKYPASDKFLNVVASALLLLEAFATNDRETAGCLLLLSTMADDDARLGIGTGNAYVCVRTMRAAIKQCIMILRCLSPGAI